MNHLCCSLSGQLWSRHSASLGLGFLICEMEMNNSIHHIGLSWGACKKIGEKCLTWFLAHSRSTGGASHHCCCLVIAPSMLLPLGREGNPRSHPGSALCQLSDSG